MRKLFRNQVYRNKKYINKNKKKTKETNNY